MNIITKGLQAVWRTLANKVGITIPGDYYIQIINLLVQPGERRIVTLRSPYSGTFKVNFITAGCRSTPAMIEFKDGEGRLEVWHMWSSPRQVVGFVAVPTPRV